MYQLFQKLFRSYNTSFCEEITPVLNTGAKDALDQYLWHPGERKISYMSLTYGILRKLSSPSENLALSIHKVHHHGRYAMVIFDLPWSEEKNHYSPIILDLKTRKIVGILLPFNEIIPHLSKSQFKRISEFSAIWISFIIKNGLMPGS